MKSVVTTTLITLFFLTLLSILPSCEKGNNGSAKLFRKSEKPDGSEGGGRNDKAPDAPPSSTAEMDQPQEFAISAKDVGKIESFTPDTFIKVMILYGRKSREWFQESGTLPPEEQSEYIERANSRFFEQFGTTEQAYISYSQSNIEDLEEYLERHPELENLLKEY